MVTFLYMFLFFVMLCMNPQLGQTSGSFGDVWPQKHNHGMGWSPISMVTCLIRYSPMPMIFFGLGLSSITRDLKGVLNDSAICDISRLLFVFHHPLL